MISTSQNCSLCISTLSLSSIFWLQPDITDSIAKLILGLLRRKSATTPRLQRQTDNSMHNKEASILLTSRFETRDAIWTEGGKYCQHLVVISDQLNVCSAGRVFVPNQSSADLRVTSQRHTQSVGQECPCQDAAEMLQALNSDKRGQYVLGAVVKDPADPQSSHSSPNNF